MQLPVRDLFGNIGDRSRGSIHSETNINAMINIAGITVVVGRGLSWLLVCVFVLLLLLFVFEDGGAGG